MTWILTDTGVYLACRGLDVCKAQQWLKGSKIFLEFRRALGT